MYTFLYIFIFLFLLDRKGFEFIPCEELRECLYFRF
nr:MAG TPA: hypothetical protein [Caudoviricetes sp.]